MIKFKNVAGQSFLAVGTIQRKSALNGEKSLIGTIYDGDDVLNKIDKGWSLEFGDEPYVITYFERNDNDNTVSFDAIHRFFWNTAKSVLYTSTSGSHTVKWYLDQIFSNTGYTYALNYAPTAIGKDNWGMKTKLSLFNDIISSISGEFEINGTLVSIFEKVGTDLSTIVRYGFNLSDMSVENNAAGFVTYGEGFGAYADQQNQKGDRLHVTYTSPLANVYGKLQAEPVDDQRFAIQSNLLNAVKAKVDGSFSVSIKLSLYDLTAAGYPYKMANVGDWLMAIDERLDFKQRIRIISIDDEFSAEGTRISYTVTAGNVGIVQKYQDSNASLATQVNNAMDAANQAVTDANFALIAANGKNTSYYVDSFDILPKTANEGDLGWVQTGDGRVLYIYTKKPDGSFYWEKRIDPEMGEQIAAGVEEAVSTAKSNSDKAIEDNNVLINQTINTVSKQQADNAIQAGDFNNKAQAMADKALADAKSSAATVAQETLNSANDSIAQAKSDITDAYKNADGVISKKVDDTATSIGNTISQNKIDSDGKISTAQSTATQAINAVTTKVSQTVYDQKTGDLTTAVSKAQTTADGAVSTVGNYKTSNDGRVKAAESKIEQNSKDITARVSKTDYDNNNSQLNTRFTKVEATADGASTTVGKLQTAVNNLGQVNQLFNTEFTPDLQGWTLDADKGSNAPYASFVSYGSRGIGFNTANADANTFASLSQTVILPSTRLSTDVMSLSWRVNTRRMDNYCHILLAWQDDKGTKVADYTMGNWNDSTLNNYNVLKWENISIPIDAKQVDIRFETREGTNAYIFQPMVSFTDTIGDYVPGNYNNNAALAQVKITADGVSSIVSNPTTGLSTRVQTAEGALSKVQGTDIPALQNATFWQPYSSLNFNDYTKQGSFFFNTTAAKTNGPTTSNGWLYLIVEQGTSDSTRIKQTAWYDGVTEAKITYIRTLNSGTWSPWYANDNDSVTTISQTNSDVRQEISDRITGDNNTLQSSKDFTQSTITNYNSGLQSQLTQTSSAFLATVSASNLVLDSSLTDSSFSNSIVNWIPSGSLNWYYSPGISYQGVQSMGYNQTSDSGTYSFVDSQTWSSNSFSGSTLNVSVDVKANAMGGTSTDYLVVMLMEQDNNGKQTQRTDITGTLRVANTSWTNYRNKITVNSASKKFFIRYQMRGNGNVYVARPYVGVQELIAGGYIASTNNNNQTILSLFKDNWSIGINDNIQGIVSGIVGTPTQMSLISKNITLDGNTTVTGDFYALGGNFKNLNASNMTVGTLNGNQVNVTNINANNIVAGTISGANLSINLNTGQVSFQKGRIYSSDYTTDINIDSGYIATSSSTTKAILRQGRLQLVDPSYIDPNTVPYLDISNLGGGLGNTYTFGALVTGRDNITLSNSANKTPLLSGMIGVEQLAGIFAGRGNDGTWYPTRVGGANRGVIISGGNNTTSDIIGSSPYIFVGVQGDLGTQFGNRILINGELVHIPSAYKHTSSSSANVVVANDGALIRSSSASKYKLDIKNDVDLEDSLKLIDVSLSTWIDKHEHEESGSNERYFGMIAEDLRDVGLEYLVQYGDDNEVEGINYDRVALLLIPLVKKMYEKMKMEKAS
ncbi:phage tail protein [Leuconostoc gasicomitatum]|uniref:phage tail protein n=1 Tax=Leuconostoc gasicomitatum TaxID=115778 RepID=UPI001CC4BE18|nr:phage tail protein [Leuconostoc gasicomitatum]MBZ5980379.1 hypothetical protein [Leuconostoc gasicomitatum]